MNEHTAISLFLLADPLYEPREIGWDFPENGRKLQFPCQQDQRLIDVHSRHRGPDLVEDTQTEPELR